MLLAVSIKKTWWICGQLCQSCGTQDSPQTQLVSVGICAEKWGLRAHFLCHKNWPPHLGHPECFGWNRKSGSIEKQDKKVVNKSKSGIKKEEPHLGGIKHKVIYMMQIQKVVKLIWTLGRWRGKSLALKFTFLSSKLQISTSGVASPPSSYAPNVPGGKKPTTQNIWIRFNLKMGIWLLLLTWYTKANVSIFYLETDIKNLLISVVLYLCCLETEVLGIWDIHPYFFGASQKLKH